MSSHSAEQPLQVLKRKNILERWGLSVDELTAIVDANPSMRGLMLGYVAEYVLRKRYFDDPRLEGVGKDDDHDRTKKGDLRFNYKGHAFRVECKSLQSTLIKKLGDGKYKAVYQCDASDRRPVQFKDGSTVETTCLLVGEFDICAINLFAFEDEWRFAFALNNDLPRSKYKGYTEFQRSCLLASSMPITLPLEWPYVDDPYHLMDLVVAGGKSLPKPV